MKKKPMPPRISFMQGTRVVRGPDWMWGDQDGGEGNTGTVISLSDSDQPWSNQTANVVWDSGFKGRYRCGPKGSHDLRVVSFPTFGEAHPNITCGGCLNKEIWGMRWLCITCKVNFCTDCYLKKTQHNPSHRKFKRYDNPKTKNPCVVSNGTCENDSDSRIPLKGIFPGAFVFQGPPSCRYGREDERKIGLVIANPEGIFGAEILVEWLPDRKSLTRHGRLDGAKSKLTIKESGIGGYYHPGGFPTFNIRPRKRTVPPRPSFSVGDRVLVLQDEICRPKELHMKDSTDQGETVENLEGSIGTVESILHSVIHVKFQSFERSKRMNSNVLEKKNKFSVGESVRVLNDEITLKEIEKEFGIVNIEETNDMIGRVSGIDRKDPGKVYVNFDDQNMHTWLLKGRSLPFVWMEHFHHVESSMEKKLADFTSMGISSFLQAIGKGDLHNAKLLYSHHNIDVNSRNIVDGTTGLHLACRRGNKDLVSWLIDEAKANVEDEDISGLRAIHYAAIKGDVVLLEMLMKSGAQLNKQTDLGKTALHFSVSNLNTDCMRLLIQRGCDLNLQDCNGETPLHSAIASGIAPPSLIQALTSCGRIKWSFINTKGFNVLQTAVAMDNLEAIGFILKHENCALASSPMPNTESTTILHYACTRRKFQMVKLLLNHLIIDVTKRDGRLFIPSGLEKLLEAKDEWGMTALLIACKKKDSALIEFLIEAGANSKAVDEDGRTAIVLAAYSLDEDRIPNKELSPKIHKLYETIQKEVTEKYVLLLSLATFLVDNSCCWKAASRILIDKGCPQASIDAIQALYESKTGSFPSGEMDGCVGLRGKCPNPPAVHITCPHKPPFKSCYNCILSVGQFKCGCSIKKTIPIIQQSHESPSSPIEDSKLNILIDDDILIVKEEPGISSSLKWIYDGTPNGCIYDGFGCKYDCSGLLDNGVMVYRCTKQLAGFKLGRCTAVVHRTLNSKGETLKMLFETPEHNHPVKKRKREGSSPSGSEELSPSAAKQQRKME